jgi:RimJ/RimL family protein N-acetyltransferase
VNELLVRDTKILAMAKNPVLLDLPESFETPRLLLRCPRAGDGEIMQEAILESFDELHRFMYWARTEGSVEEREANVRLGHANYLARKDLPVLIFRREDGRFLGGSGLHEADWTVPKFEIGYWLRTSETGKGYMTEAVAGIARIAFDRLEARRVEIRCDSRNERSVALAERLGFEREANLRNHRRAPDGEVSDTLVFARLDTEGLPRFD